MRLTLYNSSKFEIAGSEQKKYPNQSTHNNMKMAKCKHDDKNLKNLKINKQAYKNEVKNINNVL